MGPQLNQRHRQNGNTKTRTPSSNRAKRPRGLISLCLRQLDQTSEIKWRIEHEIELGGPDYNRAAPTPRQLLRTRTKP